MTGPTAEPLTEAQTQPQTEAGTEPEAGPLVSVLLDATGAEPEATRRTWRSLVAQDDEAWELLVCGTVVPALTKHPRATVVDAPRDDAGERLNALLAAAAGELVVVVDPGAEPAAHAIGALSAQARRNPEVALLLTDEVVERWDRPGIELRRKPAWSPEHLRHACYPGRLTAVRRALVTELGGYGAGFDGAHEHDLLLRISEGRPEVVRLPELLCRSAGRPGPEATSPRGLGHVRAVQEHLDRRGHGATAAPGPVPGTVSVSRTLPPGTTVSVVIASDAASGLAWGDRGFHVVGAVQSFLAAGTNAVVDVTVVHTDKAPEELLRRLRALGGPVRLIRSEGRFHLTRMRNRGVLESTGDVVVLADERVQAEGADFLDQLVAPLLEGEIGITGPRVLTAGGFHAGAGVAAYADQAEPMLINLLDGDLESPEPLLAVSRECSALLASCVALTRTTYQRVGGLNERMTQFHTVDLSAKVGFIGLSTVWVRPAVARWFPLRAAQDRKLVGTIKDAEHYRLDERWNLAELDRFVPEYGEKLMLKNHLEELESDLADLGEKPPVTEPVEPRKRQRRLARRVALLNRLP